MPSLLKSLELHGYKTFASSTLFEFASMVTAIVGPNGSGKSNIADALRWVLGEQSYSLLRGKKTEDMIFSGSEQRSRAGMAAATVTFDNTNGWLPIDFSEVAISRRAYRDGQNEYLLNGQRVRLRDVSELLAQSGLAERTYTIIGQGLVDAALSLKAEERRRLFEEAAGIGLHRSRREEALRRMEVTQRNLERVHDILSELQPRLHSLERQARRAQEFEQIRADLHEVLRAWYGYHWHRAQKELAEAREFIHQRETELESARGAQSLLEQQLKRTRGRVQGIRTQVSGWRQRFTDLTFKRESVSQDLAVAGERNRSIEAQINNLNNQLALGGEELAWHTERLQSADADLDKCRSNLEDIQIQTSNAKRAYESRLAERVSVEIALRNSREGISQVETRRLQAEARRVERFALVERQRGTLEVLEAELSNGEKDLSAFTQQMVESKHKLEEARKNRAEIESARQDQLQIIENYKLTRSQLLEDKAQLQTKIAGLQVQLEVIEQAERALTGYASGTRVLVNAAAQDQMSGIRGVFSRLLEIPAGLEVAIAASLGEFLDAVVIEEEALTEKAIDLLLSTMARGVILPIDVISSRDIVADFTIDDPQVLGVASKLVNAPPEIRQAINLLLGQVIVVRNRATARRLIRRFRGEILIRQDKSDLMIGGSENSLVNLRLVTLDGEVYFTSGPIIAGKEQQSDLLERQRLRRELVKQLDEAEKSMQRTEEEIKSQESNLTQLQVRNEEIKKRLEEAENDEETVLRVKIERESVSEQVQQKINWQRQQIDRLREEVSESEALIASLSVQFRQYEEEIAVAQEDLSIHSVALRELISEELQLELSHWETQKALAERALSEAEARLQERTDTLEKARMAIEDINEKINENSARMRDLKELTERNSQEEMAINNDIKEVQGLIHHAEQEIATLENEQDTLLREERKTRKGLNIAEHQHAQARINLARRQEALDTLRHKIEDDFGLVAFEYAEEISGPTPLPLKGMVENLPMISQLSPEIEETLKRQRALLRRMGAINPEAQAEYHDVRERFEFLTEQVGDLERAEEDLRRVITELDQLMEREFLKTFEAVAEEFHLIFSRLFGGGSARLVLTDPDDLTGTGIDIEARLPGRREQGLSLLSGGERSLTAAALVFSLLKVSPTPFCVLDEVDAMLDEGNVARYRELLRELSSSTQFIIITHNRNTVQAADVIYGVTMSRDSTSQVISLKFDEVAEVVT